MRKSQHFIDICAIPYKGTLVNGEYPDKRVHNKKIQYGTRTGFLATHIRISTVSTYMRISISYIPYQTVLKIKIKQLGVGRKVIHHCYIKAT